MVLVRKPPQFGLSKINEGNDKEISITWSAVFLVKTLESDLAFAELGKRIRFDNESLTANFRICNTPVVGGVPKVIVLADSYLYCSITQAKRTSSRGYSIEALITATSI